jgi:hypothetical protein
VRFWNADVIKNIEGVLSILEQEISPLLTSPQKGEEKIIDAFVSQLITIHLSYAL